MPVDGKPMLHDITADMKRACESILPAIVEATTQMIARFDPEFQAKIRKNIVLAGGGSLIGGIREYFQDALKEYGPSTVTCVKRPALRRLRRRAQARAGDARAVLGEALMRQRAALAAAALAGARARRRRLRAWSLADAVRHRHRRTTSTEDGENVNGIWAGHDRERRGRRVPGRQRHGVGPARHPRRAPAAP